MKIVDVRLTGLSGGTADGGWPGGMKPGGGPQHDRLRSSRTRGWSSLAPPLRARPSSRPVVALLAAAPDSASRRRQPARVSESLPRQSTFRQGRGGRGRHAISGIDIALAGTSWGHLWLKPCRVLGGRHRTRIKPHCLLSVLTQPPPLRQKLHQTTAPGFKAIKLGWRPRRLRDRRTDESLIQDGPLCRGPDVVRWWTLAAASSSGPHGYKLGCKRCRRGRVRAWSGRGALPPDMTGGSSSLAAIRRCRSPPARC